MSEDTINKGTKDRKEIEAQNEKIKTRFLQVFESIDEGIVYQDSNGMITNANQAAQDILGITLDQMQGRSSMHPEWRSIHEDGSDYPGQTHPAMITLSTGEIVREKIMGVYHPEKAEHVWIKITSYPLKDKNGAVTGAYTTFDNITSEYLKTKALEESEMKFKVVFDNAYQFIGLLEPDGTVLDANNTGLKFIGVTREQAIGAKLWETPQYALTEKASSQLQKAIEHAAKGNFIRFDFDLTGEDGETITLDFSLRPIFNANKEVTLLIPEGRDITERIELQQALESEKALNELQSHFVMSASHQFRTPLTIIKSNAELLMEFTNEMDSKLQEQFKFVTDRISKQVERTIDIMDDIMLLGKIQSGALEPSAEPFRLSELIKEIENDYRTTESAGRLKLRFSGEEKDVILDRKLLKESVQNLISNAMKYSENDVVVKLSCRSTTFTIEVKDRGLGIKPEDQKNLFQPFYRSQDVKDFNGTGLGLSIAKEYIESQGGRLTFKSELGKGTTFKIKIPYEL